MTTRKSFDVETTSSYISVNRKSRSLVYFSVVGFHEQPGLSEWPNVRRIRA